MYFYGLRIFMYMYVHTNVSLPFSYQFNAGQFDVQMVAMALLKALMQLPENEFTFFKVPHSNEQGMHLPTCVCVQ